MNTPTQSEQVCLANPRIRRLGDYQECCDFYSAFSASLREIKSAFRHPIRFRVLYNVSGMAEGKSITRYRITDHAQNEMARRQITEEDVAKVLINPEQVETVREGREVYQRRYQLGNPPKTYLLRVFVDVDRTPPEVVTAYRTSKIMKYWSVHDESDLQS